SARPRRSRPSGARASKRSRAEGHDGQQAQSDAGEEPARTAQEHRRVRARPRAAPHSPERVRVGHPGEPRHDRRRHPPAARRERRLKPMRLNTLKPAPGSRRPARRVGRGASAGQGKTCGRGTKGQRARKGGYHKVGFEGGQMPLQRRMPKVGFRSAMKRSRAEVRLSELAKVEGGLVDLQALLKAGVVPPGTERAKVVLSGALARAVTLKGVAVTKGARAVIEAAGGKIEAWKRAMATTSLTNPASAFSEAARFGDIRNRVPFRS